MSFVMRVLAMNQRSFLDETVYLASFDVNWADGLGRADFTTEVDLAMRFDDASALLRTWRTRSTVAPMRGDGRPNRPLTALTIETEKYQPKEES